MTEVTQADRECLWAVDCLLSSARTGELHILEKAINEGREIIARHRTTAEAAKDARIKELEAALAASEQRFNDCRTMLLATGASLAEARKEIDNG